MAWENKKTKRNDHKEKKNITKKTKQSTQRCAMLFEKIYVVKTNSVEKVESRR